MSDEQVLPALRKKIFRSYAMIVALLGIVGSLLVVVWVFVATGLTPKALHRNYDSIEAAGKMQEAWDALAHPEEYSERAVTDWQRQFEEALNFELKNITEPGEDKIAQEVKLIWEQRKSTVASPATNQILHQRIKELIRLNEAGMFRYILEGLVFRRNAIIAAFGMFFLVLIVTLYIADDLAERLALPLRTIAEVLRTKPKPGNKLKLPTPTSLEVKILTEELSSMWQRIGRSDQLNIEEIEKQRQNLLTLLTAMEDGILVLDAEDNITHVNLRMAEILGLSESEIVGKSWLDLSTASENYLKLREILNVDLPDTNAFELKSDAEKSRVYAARTRLVPGAKGQESKIYLLHDITEIKQREILKAEFVGVLSHELKTPLQSLSTASDLLLKSKDRLDDRSQLLAETIAEDVSRIRGVANDFVQVSQVSGGAVRVRPEVCAVSDLLPQWIKPFQVLAKEKEVSLRYKKSGSDKILARIDPVKFPWVISNLVSNAVRVSPSGSTVEVFLSELEGNCVVEVKDEGPGITEDVQRRMFDPYYQGGPDVSKLSGIMGIGLTIAKEITEAHNGKLEYVKLTPKGSNFRVLLPLTGKEG